MTDSQPDPQPASRRPLAGRAGHRLGLEWHRHASAVPLELFFDLVFVLGFTQCTALMIHEESWTGIAQGMLVLAMLWWAWVLYAWLTSVVQPEEGVVRVVVLAAMAGLLVVALSIPGAFTTSGTAFALAYGFIRLAHILLYMVGDREGSGLRSEILRFASTTGVAVTLLLVSASIGSVGLKLALWAAAIVIDWGSALIGDSQWALEPAHFAERHNLVILVALGESIVALGAGADVGLTGPVVVAAVLGVGLASALWWLYFDVVAIVTRHRLVDAPAGSARMRLARDSYSYLHFPMVAGIVLTALGLERTLHHVHSPLTVVDRFALAGGAAIYLLAHVALRLRNARTVNRQRTVIAVVLVGLIAPTGRLEAVAVLAVVVGLLWALIAYETFHVYDPQHRYSLRHHPDPGPRPA